MSKIGIRSLITNIKFAKDYLDLKTFGAVANVAAVINVPKIKRK